MYVEKQLKFCYNFMGIKLKEYIEIEKSIITTYRNKIYKKFRKALEEFELIKKGDKIAVCISGGKDSMLMAKCFQEFQKHGNIEFDLVFLVMDPGYSKENVAIIENNAKLLNIPIQIFNSNIFSIIEKSIEDSPCFLCAKMRRGVLYGQAEKLGCNKIALGHHYDDAIETLLINIFYGGEIKTMLPKVHSENHRLELIRPMFLIREEDIINWKNSNELNFINCACKFSKEKAEQDSKRLKVKNIINELNKDNKYVAKSIFHSMSNVNLDAILGWSKEKQYYNFLEDYDNKI